MNHRPFEDWLLADEQLSTEQTRDLRAHLQTCKTCSALAEVNVALRSAHTARPDSEFTDRFAVRLSAYRALQRQRAILGAVMLVVCSAGTLVWLGSSTFPLLEHSPSALLVTWLANLAYLIAGLQAINAVGPVFLRVLPDLVPPLWLGLGGLVFAGLSAVWVFTLWRVNKVVEGAQA